MGARAATAIRPTAIALLVVGLFLASPSGSASPDQLPVAQAVEEVQGAGWIERAACLGCLALVYGAGGATIGGALIIAAVAPDLVAPCIFGCVVAFS